MPMTSISLKPESEIRMKIAFAAFALIALFVKDVRCILDYADTFKTQINQANIIVTQVEAEIGSLGGLDNINAKIDDIKVDLQRDVNNSNVMEGIKSIHDLLDHKSELLEGVSSSELTKVKIEGLLVGLGVQMDNLMSTLFDALENDIGDGLRRLGLKTIPKKDVKKMKKVTGNVTSLIKILARNDNIPAPVMDILEQVKKNIKKGNLLVAITDGRLVNKTFLEDFPEIPEDELKILEDFEIAILEVEEELNKTLNDRVKKKLKLIDDVMFSNATRRKVKRLLADLEIPIDNLDEGLSTNLDTEIKESMRRLGLGSLPEADIKQLEPLTGFVSSVINKLTRSEEIPEAVVKIARKVRKSLDDGDLLKAVKATMQMNITFLQEFLSMSEDQFEIIGDLEVGILGIQKGMDKILSRRLKKKLKLIADGTFSTNTRKLIKRLLKSLGFRKRARGNKNNKSKSRKEDVEEKLKKLNLDKIPGDDIKKLEPLSKVVTSLITNLTETAEVPTAISDITKKVETFVNDGDIINAVKSARQINSTFLKDFPSLSVQQLSMLDDFEVAAVALHSGVDTMLDARVAAQTSTDNSHNEGTMTEWGVGTVVISALLCMEIHGTF